MDRKTILYDTHLKYNGRIVPFGGYLLPVQFPTGVIKEHMAVRTACGIFDTCHMGEIVCRGPKALEALNQLLTNDYTTLKVGSARYGIICNEEGGAMDDLIVHRMDEDVYMLAVNAATKDKDMAWIMDHTFGAEFEDYSDRTGTIAMQGPLSEKILSKFVAEEYIPQKNYTFKYPAEIKGMKALIARTGYTGEDGFEIYVATENIVELWELLLAEGAEDGLIPCGLGARDTLRLEAGMPLYGHELNENIDPLEAGLNYGIKMNKPFFIGKDAIAAKGEPSIVRVGIEVTGRGIIREEQDLYIGDEKIGFTTSGTHCPYIKKAIAMAYVDAAHSAVGTELEADVRGRRVAAKIVPLPFYKRSK